MSEEMSLIYDDYINQYRNFMAGRRGSIPPEMPECLAVILAQEAENDKN